VRLAQSRAIGPASGPGIWDSDGCGTSDAGCTAIVALLDMAAEHRRPARRDGAHDPSLDAPEMTGACPSKRFAMAAEDIRHLQSRNHSSRSAGRHDFQAEPIERARRVADRFGGDAGVACRARAGMAEP